MKILKVVEIMADSETSWEDAAANAVKHASKTIRNIKSAWVQDQSMTVKDGAISKYRVTVKITFEVNDDKA